MNVAADAPILVDGTCDLSFSAVRETFWENFRRRNEVGAAVCVYQDGRKVVDLWGGYKDLERTDPVGSRTRSSS